MTVDVLLHENRQFPPSDAFKEQAHVKDYSLHNAAQQNPEKFWDTCAKDLTWFSPYTQVKDDSAGIPFTKWFVNGKLNPSFDCLDKNLLNGLKDKAAIIWEGEPGDKRTLTYEELHLEVCRFANVLKDLNVQKGDRVAIYLPLIPEAVVAMLACARIGAVHTVIFGGFSSDALKDRIQDAQAVLLVTADGGWRKGQQVPLKMMADKAVEECPSIQNVVVVRRTGHSVPMNAKDHWYHELTEKAAQQYLPEQMDAEDRLFILYTSGTTGKPKGIVHTTGGYMVGVHQTTKWVFDVKPSDIYWCTADVGWITGHSYVVYGPLSNGLTVFLYEGAPDYPLRDRFWQMIDTYKITIFYTAPTAIRSFMKWGEIKQDLTSLRLLGSVGEPINPEAWMWYHENVGKTRCPIVDTWWQTETGSIMISSLPGLTAAKPGSAAKPLPGIQAAVLDEKGDPVNSGLLAITQPWPSMLRGVYGDEKRYLETYWSKWKDQFYFTGDGAHLDADGYFWLLGRVDDVMSVSGHRIGTMEVESAFVDHSSVAEAAVVGVADEIKGQAIAAFVILKEGHTAGEDELKQHVVQKIGAVARPKKVIFTRELPKTRSGKIMRRLLRDIAEGRLLGDVTTLSDPTIIEDLKKKYEDENE